MNVPPLPSCGGHHNSAIINSVERVFPSTHVILDDWHLTKNQLKNSNALEKTLVDPFTSKDISKALCGNYRNAVESQSLSNSLKSGALLRMTTWLGWKFRGGFKACPILTTGWWSSAFIGLLARNASFVVFKGG